MNVHNRRRWPSWKNLKPRFKLNQINIFGFCGSSQWVLDTDIEQQPLLFSDMEQQRSSWDTITPGSYIGGTTMNLATALAAERRQVQMEARDWVTVEKPLKSIVRLIGDVKVSHDDGKDVGRGINTLCCLCTERNKGAALIPCGHTYCRVCSRAMWSKRKACPLCNRLIMDVLEIL